LRSIYALAIRRIGLKLSDTLPQLTDGTYVIRALGMIETYGDVNKRLQKQSPRSAFQPPRFLQYLMASEKLAVIKEPDSLQQLVIHRSVSVM
jgi:hypothetical protein